MLYLGSIGTVSVISISHYKETILQRIRNYRKMTIPWSFSYNSFVKSLAIFGSIGTDSVISESCYEGTILQRNYRKMTIPWSISYNCFVKFHAIFGVHRNGQCDK